MQHYPHRQYPARRTASLLFWSIVSRLKYIEFSINLAKNWHTPANILEWYDYNTFQKVGKNAYLQPHPFCSNWDSRWTDHRTIFFECPPRWACCRRRELRDHKEENSSANRWWKLTTHPQWDLSIMPKCSIAGPKEQLPPIRFAWFP